MKRLPGTTMDDPSGLMKPMSEMMATMDHLRWGDQFLGSSWPSSVTAERLRMGVRGADTCCCCSP